MHLRNFVSSLFQLIVFGLTKKANSPSFPSTEIHLLYTIIPKYHSELLEKQFKNLPHFDCVSIWMQTQTTLELSSNDGTSNAIILRCGLWRWWWWHQVNFALILFPISCFHLNRFVCDVKQVQFNHRIAMHTSNNRFPSLYYLFLQFENYCFAKNRN